MGIAGVITEMTFSAAANAFTVNQERAGGSQWYVIAIALNGIQRRLEPCLSVIPGYSQLDVCVGEQNVRRDNIQTGDMGLMHRERF
jgi:hypothetical protein